MAMPPFSPPSAAPAYGMIPRTPVGMPSFPTPALSPADRAIDALRAFKTPPRAPSALGSLPRLLPYLAIPLIPAAIGGLLEPFAPGVQDWLRRGWKTPGYGVPDGLAPGQVAPGSRAVFYQVYTTASVNAGGCTQFTQAEGYQGIHLGPITRAEVPAGTTPLGCPTDPQTSFDVRIRRGNGTTIANAFKHIPANIGDINFRAVPLDGQPEGVPNPNLPSSPVPYAPVQNPQPGISPIVPIRAPQTPLTVPAPVPVPALPPSISPIAPQRQPALPPQISPQPASAPQATPQPSVVPGSNGTGIPLPALPPPTYPPSAPERTSSRCEDPCLKGLADKLDELFEKVKEKEPEEPECPECPECPSVDFPVATVACEDGEPKVRAWTLKLAEAAPAGFLEAMERMASAASKGCQAEPIAAFPDWWQTRIGAGRPQVVIVYRSGGTSAYHSLSLPHPIHTSKWDTNRLGNYRSGSVHGILTLADNSKFIVNAESEAEAKRVIAIARTLINPAFLGSAAIEAISRKEGRVVENRVRVGTSASYFPDGQRDFSPEWKAVFGNLS